MNEYTEIILNTVHDLTILAKRIDEGLCQDLDVLKASISLAHDLEKKMIEEASRIYSHPVLFST